MIRVLASIAWGVVLLAILLPLAEALPWPALPLADADTTRFTDLRPQAQWLYLGFAIGPALAAIALSTHRNVTLATFLIVAIAIESRTGWIGAIGLLSALGATLLIGTLYFLVAHNRALAASVLRSTTRREQLRVLTRTLFLWSPMIIVIMAGLFVSRQIDALVTALVYELTPIDRYCQSDADQPLFPCEGIDLDVAADVVEPTMPPAVEAIQHHAAIRIDHAQRELREQLDSTDANAWSDAQIEQTLSQLERFFRGDRLITWEHLGGTRGEPETDAQRLLADLQRQYDQTDETIEVVQRVRLRGLFGNVTIPVPQRVPNPARTALLPQINSAQAAVASELKQALNDPRVRAQKLGLRISVAQQSRGFDLFALRAILDSADELERRAIVEGRLVAWFADLEDYLLPDVQNAVASHAAELATTGLPDTSVEDLESATLGLRGRYCSFPTEIASDDAGIGGQPRARPDVVRFPCEAVSAVSSVGGRVAPVSLHSSILRSINVWEAQRLAEVDREYRKTMRDVATGVVSGTDAALGLLGKVPETVDLGRGRCRWYSPSTWIECAKNRAKAWGEAAYARARAEAGAAYRAQVARTSRDASASGFSAVVASRPLADDLVKTSARDLEAAVRQVTFAFDALRIIGLIVLGFAVAKSLVYVLAHVLFHTSGPASLQWSAVDSPVGKLSISNDAIELEGVTQRIITKTPQINQLRRLTFLRWPLVAIATRIRHGWYFMMNCSGPLASGKAVARFHKRGEANAPIWITMQCPPGDRLVRWDLVPGEEVVFDYANLVAVSESVELRSRLSLRLDALLTGRIFIHSALAPDGGLLVLRIRGATFDDPERVRVFGAEQLVAYSACCRFRVEAQPLDQRAVFLDGFQLLRESSTSGRDDGHVISEVAPMRSAIGVFVRHALALFAPI